MPVSPSPPSLARVPLVAPDTGQHGVGFAPLFSRAITALGRFKVQLVWLVIGIGVALRCLHYLSNRSLWLDEARLALNIVQKTFSQLFQPLDYGQAAPIGFLMIEKLAVLLLGNNEYALRLFPLLCGVASIFLFSALGRRCVTPATTLVALVLFVSSRPLLYYSAEVKQYAGDVVVALTLSLLALPWLGRDRLTVRHAACFGVMGIVGLWFSHPAVFVLAGIGTTLAVTSLLARDWRRLGLLSLTGTLWGLSFLVAYVTMLRSLSNDEFFLHAWRKSFVPLIPHTLPELLWPAKALYSLLSGALGISPPVAVVAFLVGGYVLWRENRPLLFFLLSPALFTVLASGLQIYPFSDRLILFLAPACLLVIAAGVAHVWEVTRQRSPVIGVAFAGVLCALTISKGLTAFQPRQEIKPLLHYFATQRQAGDVLYVYHGALSALQYYQDRYGITAYVTGTWAVGDWDRYRDELAQLRGHKRVWVLFSHVNRSSGVDEEKLFLHYLDSWGVRQDAQRTDEQASLYLYDLALPP
ncbi:MAG: hypothetical protein NZ578_09740 [Candidatus Binatia bacterium]|nr:hypothetical protein [Candidatus Binatia bacterium]